MKAYTKVAAAGLIAALMPASASALGIDVRTFTSLGDARSAYATEAAKFTAFAVEDFEDRVTEPVPLGQISGTLNTRVGGFTTVSGTGSGTSAIGDGTNLAVRQDSETNDGGRFNTTLGGSRYLDSNDTNGIRWSIPGSVPDGLGLFDRILFTLVDVADQGRILTINALDADGSAYNTTRTIMSQGPSTINTVLISFTAPVSIATILLAKNGTNDGFSIDDARVGAIPLPAAAWLLLAASGGLIAAKRRRNRRAA
jgi:hypothetical protein